MAFFSELGLTLIYNVSLILTPVSHNDGKILGSGQAVNDLKF